MARISVEQVALIDSRYAILGSLLRTSRHDALGRMVIVWNECQEKHTYTLPAIVVNAIMERQDGAQLVVDSQLATWESEGVLRICGTEGRIEWLQKKRSSAAKGGASRAKDARRDEKGHFQPSSSQAAGQPPATTQPNAGFVQANPSAPAPAPALKILSDDGCSSTTVLPAPVEKPVENIAQGDTAPAQGLLEFLEAQAKAKGNSFTKAQRGQLLESLASMAQEYAVDLLEVAVGEVFRSGDPPRVPDVIMARVALEADSLRYARVGKGREGGAP